MADGGAQVYSDAQSLAKALAHCAQGHIPALRTAPHAARRLGPHYLKAVLDRRHLPAAIAVIDCGDDAGLVLKSLAAGWRRIAFSGAPVLAHKLADIAKKRQATLTTDPIEEEATS
jgi:hypothetical protein